MLFFFFVKTKIYNKYDLQRFTKTKIYKNLQMRFSYISTFINDE